MMMASKWKPYLDYKLISHAGIEKNSKSLGFETNALCVQRTGRVSKDGTEELLSVSKYTG